MRSKILTVVFIAHLLAMPSAVALDQTLPPYQTVGGIAGQIKSVGSDTLNNEMELWAKAFGERYADVKIIIEGKGSATAPPALLDGISQFGPMSRLMTAAESEAFEKKFGYKVSSLAVAVDALAVYVNKDNPIRCLTMEQVDRIFSSTRKGSGGRSIDTWGDVGLTGEWATKPISIYGRNDISGTYEFFREIALYDGDYKPEVKQQVGSEAVVGNIASDKFAIGYSGIGYKTDGSVLSRWPYSLAGNATILPPRRPTRANILSRDTSTSISTRSRKSRSTRCAASLSSTFCQGTARHWLRRVGSTRSPTNCGKMS